MRIGATRRHLHGATAVMDNWPNITVARRAVDLADAGSDSPGETLSRLLVHSLGLGEVETQFGLREGDRTAWADLRVGRHLIEFDGRAKYQRVEDGGLARIDAGDVVWREKVRQDWFCGFTLGMSRLTWAEVQPAVWALTAPRLRREIEDTHRRFGTDIDDLAPYRIHRSRRPR